jgi:hypothetical protein
VAIREDARAVGTPRAANPIPEASSAVRGARERSRTRLLAAIPAHYSPWLHLAGTTGIGVAALAAAVVALGRTGRAPTLFEWAVVPSTFVIANLFEWQAHKGLLHTRRRGATVLYDRHTPEHHVVYGYDDMAIRDVRELKLVLIPAFGVALIVATAIPFAVGVGLLFGAHAGWLFLATNALYVVGYELSHASYHLPESHPIGRLPLVRVLREHHRRHHHPRLMQRWNFNVTIPIGDLVHRTIASRKTVEAAVRADLSGSSRT